MQSNSQRKLAFVIPRYGENIGGGAETLVSNMAHRLAERGDSVEILTTCAVDNRTWENFYSPCEYMDRGVTIRRFLVDQRNLDIWIPLQIRLSEGMALSPEEQLEWMTHSVNSHDMYSYISDWGPEYDTIFFAPYLFGITFFGSLIHPSKSCLIPCLHDESYAYIDSIASMFRQVKGALFNARPEMILAKSLYGDIKGDEVGMGFDPFPVEYVDSLAPYFEERFPYIIYVGRKETGKNVQSLIDYFIAAKDNGILSSEVKLVIVGGGSFDDLYRPEALTRADLIDLPHVSSQDKHRLIKNALVLCQPSTNESFSIVLMESWLLGTPVLVNEECAVTKEHAIESSGGLYFKDQYDWGEAVKSLAQDRDLAATLSNCGREYVFVKYSWPAVLDRFDHALQKLSL